MNHNTVSTYIIICIFFLKNKKEKKSLPTYPPFLIMGRPTANKDIFKSGLTCDNIYYQAIRVTITYHRIF